MSRTTRTTRTTVRAGIALAGGLALLAGALTAVSHAGTAEQRTPGAVPGTFAADPFADAPIGYAAEAGGTTGGEGGSTVAEHLLSEYADSSGLSPSEALYQLLKDHQKSEEEGLIVYVDLSLSQEGLKESKLDIKDVENVSVLGVGDAGELDGVGFKVTRSQNIIIRNLTIHHVSEGEGDAIEVTDNSSHVWIDHNDLSSERDNEPDKDHYDGLVDIKRNSEYITVSWNNIHDHWKTSLIGHNDSADQAPDKITYHNNAFTSLNTRVPLIRHADVHLLNNVFTDINGSAINARMGARVLVEGNWFENVGSGEVDSHAGYIEGPVGWFYGSSETGYWNLKDNTFIDSPHEHLESTTDFTVPYSYQADTPAAAKQAVEQYAGTGVIDVNP